MKFLALLCVCLSVATGTWAYSRDCAKGPEYWCRDASTAKDCGAVQHCEQTVWKEKHQPQKSSATGETAQMLCNVLVHASHELLAGSSVNADSIKEYLRQDCTKLPNQKKLVQQCQMAVDIYVADILRHLASGTELNKICSIIQGHDTSNVVVPKPKLSNAPTNLTCVICEFVVHLVETYASQNKSAEQIEHILEAACKQMPPVLRDECKSFVDSYGPDLIALLVREMDPDKVCAFIKVCKKSENAIVSPKPVKSIQCALCKYVVGYIDTVIQNNKSAAAIEAALEKVCTILPPSLKPGCVSFVDSYGPLLLQLILKFGTPEKVCNALKVCNNGTQEMPILEHVPMMNLQNPQLGTIPCTICKFVIGYLDTATKGNHSAAAVEAALDKVCNYLPGTLKDNCTAFVHKYGPIIAFMFLRNATAEQICDFIKVCNNGTQAVPLDIHQLSNILPSSVKSAQCSLCKYIVGYIDTVIQSNKSEAAIEAALEKVCTILPAAIKPKCDQFVVTYGPVLIQLIQKYGTPELVCNALQMCHNGTESIRSASENFGRLIKSAAPAKVASAQCELCKYVIGYVDAVIQNNKSEAAIEAALEKVCTVLPAAIKPGCVTFVQNYGPLVFQMIVKFGTPEKVCNALKICHNGTQEITPLSNSLREMLKSKQEPLRSVECSLCKYIVGYIDTVIQSNKSEAAIEAALEKVCTILPAAIKPKCDQFVVTYGPVLIQLIQKYGTPELVCNALQICHNGTESIRPAIKNFGRLIKSAAPAKVASVECALCKYVIGYIDGVIQNNKSEAAIEAALEKVCTVVPAAMKPGCVTFVQTYGPLVFNMIIKFGTPEKVCHALKMCHDEAQAVESVVHNLVESIKKAKSGGECTLCKYVLSYVNLLITANSTEAEVEKALEAICTILPSQYHDKCDGFVHTYASVLVQLLAELDDPNTVCAWLDVCPKSKKEFIPIPALKTNKVTSLPCNLCQYIVNYADTILQSNATEVKFEQALEKACKVLPGDKLQAECKTLVHLYGPDLIKYIIEYGDPKAVCQAIGLCEK